MTKKEIRNLKPGDMIRRTDASMRFTAGSLGVVTRVYKTDGASYGAHVCWFSDVCLFYKDHFYADLSRSEISLV